MDFITSHSIPLKDVLGDLAKELNVELSHICDVYSLSIPAHYGKRTIKGNDFKDGLGIIL